MHLWISKEKKLPFYEILIFNLSSESQLNSSDDSLYSIHSGSSGGSGGVGGVRTASPHRTAGGTLYHSHSNPDLSSLSALTEPLPLDYPEHVLKVYKSDQTFKFLLVHKVSHSSEFHHIMYMYLFK